MKRLLLLPALLVFLIPSLFGESSITAKMGLYNTFLTDGTGSWSGSGTGALSVSFNQTGNRNVKSRLDLNAVTNLYPSAPPGAVPDDYHFYVSRAYVKFRFPFFRAVIGKAPLSWGEGVVFNAGDLVFSSPSVSVNLMQVEFSDSNRWLTSLYFPLGPFSFIEGLYLPPELFTDGLETSKGGGRLVTKVLNTKFEAGYLYDGADSLHKLYGSLQGNFFADWYLSAAGFFPGDSAPAAFITGEIYTMRSIGYDGTLNMRMEALTQINSNTFSIYPEISYAFNSGMQFFLRSIVLLSENSAAVVPGFTWNVFQGFTIISMASFGIGKSDDVSIMAGISVVF